MHLSVRQKIKLITNSVKDKFSNKIILLTFTLTYLLFCFYIIDQYSNILSYKDLYRYFLGDGDAHIRLIWSLDSNFNLKKIHPADLYYNNYYIFSSLVLKFLKFFPGYDYSSAGISAIITNLISIYVVCITGFLICFNLSKSKFFSLGIILLVWNSDLIGFSLDIYPDILQLAFIFLAVYFVTLETKYKYFLSFVFCGLAFGVKAQGLLIFIYLIIFFIIFEFAKLNFKIGNFTILLFKKPFLYSCLFLATFFILNQIDPLQLIKSFFFNYVSDKVYNNNSITYTYFLYILREKINLLIFCITILFGLFSIFFIKENKILFLVTLFFLMLFYYQLSNLKILVQGPRYLYHIMPLLIILLSISFGNLSSYLKLKKLNIIPLIIAIVVFINGINVFNKTFFNTIEKFDFKDKIKNDPMINGYNFLKSITDKYKNSVVCAGYYSAVPIGSGGFTTVLQSYFHLDFEKEIRNKECDIIVLDSSTPGRYIWFDNNLDNLIIKKYETLGAYSKLWGKENIEKTQELIKYIIKDPLSGYKVTYKNPKLIVLIKIN
jgi:hypothetical protein